jgi:hypothetical protein
MCQICEEEETSKIDRVVLVVHRTNPKAYGYPEIVHWHEDFEVSFDKCPICGRDLGHRVGKEEAAE